MFDYFRLLQLLFMQEQKCYFFSLGTILKQPKPSKNINYPLKPICAINDIPILNIQTVIFFWEKANVLY